MFLGNGIVPLGFAARAVRFPRTYAYRAMNLEVAAAGKPLRYRDAAGNARICALPGRAVRLLGGDPEAIAAGAAADPLHRGGPVQLCQEGPEWILAGHLVAGLPDQVEPF